MSLYHIYLIPILLSFLSSLTTYRLDWPKPYKFFCIFLIITLAVEAAAILWMKQLYQTEWWNFSQNNLWIYNTYLIPQYLFYIYFFAANDSRLWVKRLSFLIAITYFIFSITNLIIFQGLFVVNFATIIFANFIVILSSVNYFVGLMKAKTVIRLSTQPIFWIAAGAFIFHLGSLPCFILYNYISSNNSALATSLFIIIVILNCLMYSFYTVAFLCTKKFPTSPY